MNACRQSNRFVLILVESGNFGAEIYHKQKENQIQVKTRSDFELKNRLYIHIDWQSRKPNIKSFTMEIYIVYRFDNLNQ